MAKFRFKFSSVLKVRKSREDSALAALGVAQRAYQAEIAKKSALLSSLSDALARRELLGSKPTDIMAFKVEQDFITGTKARIVRADQAILRATRGVEKALRSYLQAKRQTRMIEALYEKEHAEWRKEQSKRQQKQLDDMVSMRARFATGFDIFDGDSGEVAV